MGPLRLIRFRVTTSVTAVFVTVCTLAMALGSPPQAGASTASYEFDAIAFYRTGSPSDLVPGAPGAGPDTAFVTIKNGGSSTFSGTIGFNAVTCGGANQSSVYQVTLNPGDHVSVSIDSESSNQGGFNGPCYNASSPTPQNGAQFEMRGTVTLGADSQSVDLTINDKDIHSGLPARNPFGVTLDNYILQGGDPYGRDTGDDFETSQTPAAFQFPPIPNPNLIAGKVEVGGSPVSGAHVQACPTSGGDCFVAPIPTNSGGGFAIQVPAGSYSVTALAPTSFAIQSAQTVGPFTVPPSVNTVVVNFPVNTIPTGTTFNGYTSGQVPRVYWGSPSTLTVTGCAGGFGVVYVHSTNTTTSQAETLVYPLKETSPGSGTYVAKLPALAPLHGDASMEPLIGCPGQTQLAPDGGDPAGGTKFLITGSGFTGATAVRFGSTPAGSFKVLSDHVISAVSPEGTNRVPVVVSTSSGDQAVGNFSYFGVTSMSPTSGPAGGGTVVTITGQGFTNVVGVVFGVTPAASFTVVSPTEIRAVAPAGLGTIDVQVLNGFAASKPVTAGQFAYQGGPSVGSTVNEGTGDDAPATVASQIANACSSPDVSNNGAGIDFGPMCRFAQEQLTGLTGNGPIGALFQQFVTSAVVGGIWILGLNIDVDVAILAVQLGFFAYGVLQAICESRGGCSFFGLFIDPSGNVVDTSGNPIGGATTTLLTQGPGGGFAPVDPSSGSIDPARNPETTGSDGAFEWEALAGTYEVRANAANCHAPGDPAQPNATTSSFAIPPPAVGLLLALECPGSTPPTPTVTGLSTDLGPGSGGNRVEIVGTGLADVSAVHFGGAAATGVAPISPFAVAAIAPPGTSTVDVTVTSPGGTSATSAADQYTYVSTAGSPDAPSISSVSPGAGPVSGGTNVAIDGANLDGVYSVSFGGVAAVQVTDVSSTEVDAVTPSSLVAGPVDVTVTGPRGTSAVNGSDVFQYTTGSSVPTSTSLASSEDPSVVGEQVTYTATVSPVPSGGSVDFRDGGTSIPGCASQSVNTTTGRAKCDVTYSAVGSHSIDAVFSGNSDFVGSTSNSITQSVSKAGTSVSLSFSPSAPTFGTPETITASVAVGAPGAGTPTGSVTFSVGGSLIASASLSAGQASISALLQAGTQTITAVYSGDANFAGNDATASKAVGCTTSLSGKVTGGLTVGSGQSLCLVANDTVKGSIKVGTGGALFVAGGSSVSGSVSSVGATAVSICASTVTGGASIAGSTGFVLLGDAADDAAPACGPNTFGSSLSLSGNQAGVELGGNVVKGSVTLNTTTIAAGPPFASIAEDLSAPEVEGNTITQALSCSGNTPAPVNDGHPNSAKGTKSGQCSNL